MRRDFRRERVKPLIQKILGTSLSTSLDDFVISILATLKKSNYFTFLQAWHTLGYKHNLHFSIMPLADFCETLISISKSRLSRKTLISFSISTLKNSLQKSHSRSRLSFWSWTPEKTAKKLIQGEDPNT